MKTYIKRVTFLFGVVFSLLSNAQTPEPVLNYITHSNGDSVNIHWEFTTTTTPNVSLDSFTYVFSLENADSNSSYYSEITAPIFMDSTFLAITDSVVWDSNLNDSTLYVLYEYLYYSDKKVPLFDSYYTHQASYNSEVFDKVLGTGVNYYYDEFKYNASYPIYPYNPNLNTQFQIALDRNKMENIQPEPDYFAYSTTVNGTPFNYTETYPYSGACMRIYWEDDPTTNFPDNVYFPEPSISYPDSNTEVTKTVLVNHPDTIFDDIRLVTYWFSYKNILYYPVYNQEICQGDLFTINGNVITESGLYLDSLTTTLGTDSLVGVNLIVKPFVYSDTVDMSICENSEGYVFGGTNYTEAGSYSYSDHENCDTVHFLNLSTIEIPNEIDKNNNVLTYLTPNSDYTYQWLNHTTGLPISGATSSTFSPSYNSNYVLEITFGGCTVISNQIGTNIGLDDLEGDLTCTPNPFVNSIELSFGDHEQTGYVEVYDVNSKRLIKEKFTSTVNLSLNTEHLPRGIYLIKINTEKGMYQKKMIK